MKNLPNIERSGFHTGTYVGYAAFNGVSVVYRIKRNSQGLWFAHTPNDPAPSHTARTLAELSAVFEAMK